MRIPAISVLLAAPFLVGASNIIFAREAPSASAAMSAPRSIEQLPPSAYARAEAVVPQNVRKLIYGMSVRPQWIGKSSRFWYEKQTRGGRDYLVVDAVAGTVR